ncbi:unnamed protein product, partial [Durusdinium trenchii]
MKAGGQNPPRPEFGVLLVPAGAYMMLLSLLHCRLQSPVLLGLQLPVVAVLHWTRAEHLQRCLLDWYSEMEVSFSTADWILSLGVGVEIPRMGEKAFVENLAYNAEQGVIISWGRQGQNPRSEAEVRQIFSLHGFILDELVTSYLRLFSGLAHAPERDDLLVLRKATRSASERGLVALELIDEWGFDRCAAAGVEMQHGLQGKASQYGPLGHGRMWVSGNCVGRFRAGRSGEMVLCISHSKRFRECDLPGLEPGFEQLSG